MKIELDLNFRLKSAEMPQFLDEDEAHALNQRLHDAARAIAPEERTRFLEDNVLRDARRAYCEERLAEDPGFFNRRVAERLLRTAVDLKYTKEQHGMGGGARGVEIPRKESGKRKPAVWWGEILDVFDGSSAHVLELSPEKATWLVKDVWFDDKAQNGFPATMQRWLNVMDAEMGRVLEEIEGAKKAE